MFTKPALYIYEFGAFRLDAVNRLLLRDGEVVALTPKCFDILLVLVESKGELLSKDELMQRVWPDSFVEESNLTYNISVLRKVLGERAGNHQYIVTVSGRGYRFAAEVREVVDRVEGEDAPPCNNAPSQQILKKKPVLIATLSALVVILGGFIIYRIANQPKPGTESAKTIAVLPFKLLSAENNDPEMEYLSDGISEDLINNLSQIGSIKVIARSSSFKYKGKDTDPQEVAQALGVEALVIGRVSRRGEQLQISVELMDARDKTQIWGDQYNRKLADLLAVQTEISREITEKLHSKLTNAEQQQLTKRETLNPQAYELVLRGRFYLNKGGSPNRQKAVEYFQQAIAVDPAYAPAYAYLSSCYSNQITASVLDPKEFTRKAEWAALKALNLDERLVDAHLALAGVKLISWEWAAAERELQRALELQPNNSRAHSRYSFYLSLMGRHDEAIAECNRARELDPLSLSLNWAVGYRLLLARRNDEAIEVAQKLIEMDPNYSEAYALLGYAYEAKGQYEEAIAAYQKAIKLGEHSPDIQIYLGATYAQAGEREKARSILKRLEADPNVSRGALTSIYVALGEYEKAFAALERAYETHDNQLQFLKISQSFDPLRSDPRYQDLMRRVGFTQE